MISRNEEFSTQIRQALEHLHDFAHLQSLPLVTALSNRRGQSAEQSVRRLRADLLEAIEQLNPAGDLPPRAKERRPYVILYGRYVQGLETADLMEEMAISMRQLRREQKRALRTVTTLMEERLSDVLAAPPDPPALAAGGRQEAALEEVDQLVNSTQRENLDLRPLLRQVSMLLAPVAQRHGVALYDALPPAFPAVRGQRVVLRQSLLGVLSYAIYRAGGGSVRIEGEAGDRVLLRVQAQGRVLDEPRTGVTLDISRRLVAGLGGLLTTAEVEGGWTAEMALPTAEAMPILVMDDNAGLIALFRRYLAGHSYTVLAAHTAEEAIAIAGDVPLKLILLDIMMPEQDGWEVLERLRAAPATRAVPILICSVVNEPELAFSLGASDYLTKPVTEAALLAKVERWCTVPPAPAALPTTTPAGSPDSRSS